MRRTFALLIASTAAAGLIAACSAAPESGQLAGNGTAHSAGSNTSDPSGSDSNGAAPTGGGSSGAPTGGSNPTPVDAPPAPQAPPASGPGSTASAAHADFVANVYPALNNCAACHASGALGAPKMLDADPTVAYSSLDALGLIQSNSMLLSKGAHASGAAPALSSTQVTVIQHWLALEATERAGQAAPVNILDKLAGCMDKTEFLAIGLETLRTVPRTGENTNRCTGCNKAQCSSCHGDAANPFYEQIGSKLGDNTFEMSQKQPYILKYFGLNGTEPVASNGIALKMAAVNAGQPYSHPNFTLPANVKTNLDKFVNDALAKYKAGTCAAPPATTTTP